MPEYKATVKIEGLRGKDERDVRLALQARLSAAKLEGSRVLGVEEVQRHRPPRQRPPVRIAPAQGAWRRESNAAGLMLLAAVGWAAWFFWSVLSRIVS